MQDDWCYQELLSIRDKRIAELERMRAENERLRKAAYTLQDCGLSPAEKSVDLAYELAIWRGRG